MRKVNKTLSYAKKKGIKVTVKKELSNNAGIVLRPDKIQKMNELSREIKFPE